MFKIGDIVRLRDRPELGWGTIESYQDFYGQYSTLFNGEYFSYSPQNLIKKESDDDF